MSGGLFDKIPIKHIVACILDFLVKHKTVNLIRDGHWFQTPSINFPQN